MEKPSCIINFNLKEKLRQFGKEYLKHDILFKDKSSVRREDREAALMELGRVMRLQPNEPATVDQLCQTFRDHLETTVSRMCVGEASGTGTGTGTRQPPLWMTALLARFHGPSMSNPPQAQGNREVSSVQEKYKQAVAVGEGAVGVGAVAGVVRWRGSVKARRLVEGLAARAREARSLDAPDLFRPLPGYCHLAPEQLKELWEGVWSVCMGKLQLLVGAGDSPAGVSGRAALTALSAPEWRVVDLVLLYARHDHAALVTEDSVELYDQLQPLVRLVSLVQSHQLDQPAARHVRAARWRAAHRAYNHGGVVMSLVGLQRRWYETRRVARRVLARYWRTTRRAHHDHDYVPTPTPTPTPTRTPAPAPASFYVSLVKRFPDVMVKPLPSWRDLVLRGDIIFDQWEECTATAGREPSPGTAGTETETGTDGNTDDIILIERTIETIDVESTDESDIHTESEPDPDPYPDGGTGGRDTRKEKVDDTSVDLLGIDPSRAQVTLLFDTDDEDENTPSRPATYHTNDTSRVAHLHHQDGTRVNGIVKRALSEEGDAVKVKVERKESALVMGTSESRARLVFESDSAESGDDAAEPIDEKLVMDVKICIKKLDDAPSWNKHRRGNSINVRRLRPSELLVSPPSSPRPAKRTAEDSDDEMPLKLLKRTGRERTPTPTPTPPTPPTRSVLLTPPTPPTRSVLLTPSKRFIFDKVKDRDAISVSFEEVLNERIMNAVDPVKTSKYARRSLAANALTMEGCGQDYSSAAAGVGGRVAKRVELPSREEIRRINSSLLTAQVAPIASRRVERSSGARGKGASGGRAGDEAAPRYKEKDAVESESARSDADVDTDDDSSDASVEVRPHPDGEGVLSRADLKLMLDKLSRTTRFPGAAGAGVGAGGRATSGRAYCCVARRHRAVNDARRRLADRAGKQVADLNIHDEKHMSSCTCCCVRLVRDDRPRDAMLDHQRRLDALLRHLLDATARQSENGGEPDGEPKRRRRGSKRKKKKEDPRSEAPTAPDDYQEWIRQKNINRRFFKFGPQKPDNQKSKSKNKVRSKKRRPMEITNSSEKSYPWTSAIENLVNNVKSAATPADIEVAAPAVIAPPAPGPPLPADVVPAAPLDPSTHAAHSNIALKLEPPEDMSETPVSLDVSSNECASDVPKVVEPKPEVLEVVKLEPKLMELQVLEPQPKLMELQLEVVEPQPKLMELHQEVVEPQPKLMEPQEKLVDPQSKLIELQQEVVEPQHKLMEQQQKLVEPQFKLMELQLEAVDKQPKLMEQQLEVVKSQPEVVEPQSKLMELQLQVVEKQPKLMELQLEVVKSQSEVVKSEPKLMKPQQKVVKPQPEVVQLKSEADTDVEVMPLTESNVKQHNSVFQRVVVMKRAGPQSLLLKQSSLPLRAPLPARTPAITPAVTPAITPAVTRTKDGRMEMVLVPMSCSTNTKPDGNILYAYMRSDVSRGVGDGRSSPPPIEVGEFLEGKDPTSLQLLRVNMHRPVWEVAAGYLLVTDAPLQLASDAHARYWTLAPAADTRTLLVPPPHAPPPPLLAPDYITVDDKYYRKLQDSPLKYAQVLTVLWSSDQCRALLANNCGVFTYWRRCGQLASLFARETPALQALMHRLSSLRARDARSLLRKCPALGRFLRLKKNGPAGPASPRLAGPASPRLVSDPPTDQHVVTLFSSDEEQ